MTKATKATKAELNSDDIAIAKDSSTIKESAAEILDNMQVKKNALDITSLVLVAVLFAAGCILDFTVAKMLSIGGNIQPEFVIASFCLSILLLRPKVYQGAIIGALAATLIQINTSVPLLEYVCDIPAATIMTILVLAYVRFFPKDANRKVSVFPFIATFIATLISGLIFGICAALFVIKNPNMIPIFAVVVAGTAAFNAVIVEVLYSPLKLILHK